MPGRGERGGDLPWRGCLCQACFRMPGRGDDDEVRQDAAPWSPMMEIATLEQMPAMMREAAEAKFKAESILANALAMSNEPALAVSMRGLVMTLLFLRSRTVIDTGVGGISILTRRDARGETEFCGVEVNMVVPATALSPDAVHRLPLVYEQAVMGVENRAHDNLVFGRLMKGDYTHACVSSHMTADSAGFLVTLELMHKDGARGASLPTGGDMERRLLIALNGEQCARDTSYALKQDITTALATNMRLKEAQRATESRRTPIVRAGPHVDDGRLHVGPFVRLGATTAEVLHLYSTEANASVKVHRGGPDEAPMLYVRFVPLRPPADEDRHEEARSWAAYVSPHHGRFPKAGPNRARAAPY